MNNLHDQDKMAVVASLDETRHGYETGDFVTFKEVKGMVELNDCTPREIKVLPLCIYSLVASSNNDNTLIGTRTIHLYHR